MSLTKNSVLFLLVLCLGIRPLFWFDDKLYCTPAVKAAIAAICRRCNSFSRNRRRVFFFFFYLRYDTLSKRAKCLRTIFIYLFIFITVFGYFIQLLLFTFFFSLLLQTNHNVIIATVARTCTRSKKKKITADYFIRYFIRWQMVREIPGAHGTDVLIRTRKHLGLPPLVTSLTCTEISHSIALSLSLTLTHSLCVCVCARVNSTGTVRRRRTIARLKTPLAPVRHATNRGDSFFSPFFFFFILS